MVTITSRSPAGYYITSDGKYHDSATGEVIDSSAAAYMEWAQGGGLSNPIAASSYGLHRTTLLPSGTAQVLVPTVAPTPVPVAASPITVSVAGVNALSDMTRNVYSSVYQAASTVYQQAVQQQQQQQAAQQQQQAAAATQPTQQQQQQAAQQTTSSWTGDNNKTFMLIGVILIVVALFFGGE